MMKRTAHHGGGGDDDDDEEDEDDVAAAARAAQNSAMLATARTGVAGGSAHTLANSAATWRTMVSRSSVSVSGATRT